MNFCPTALSYTFLQFIVYNLKIKKEQLLSTSTLPSLHIGKLYRSVARLSFQRNWLEILTISVVKCTCAYHMHHY